MSHEVAVRQFTSLELCAGAGGQALGLEMAGFKHLALVEIEQRACETLRINRPQWNVIGPPSDEPLVGDIYHFHAHDYRGTVDLLAGGVPCPPFSMAGKQLGHLDERDLFPEALRIIEECLPRAIMLENVRGLLNSVFKDYRASIINRLQKLGYLAEWHQLNASAFGVPQLRPRSILVALRPGVWKHFDWPDKNPEALCAPPTVGETLVKMMAANGWEGAQAWAARANSIAPTLVGGSKKHGGPDLGPTRAQQAWATLGVDGTQLANEPPLPGFVGMPRLTVPMAALIQGFPPNWEFSGKKTPAFRQVGNAFPPPVAEAMGRAIRSALIQAEANQFALAT